MISSGSAPGSGLRTTIAIAGTTAIVLLTLCAIIPPVSMAMFQFSIGASEYAPVLGLLALGFSLCVNRLVHRSSRGKWLLIAVLGVASVIDMIPLLQFHRAAEHAAAQLGMEEEQARFSLVAVARGLPGKDVTERDVVYPSAGNTPLRMRLYGAVPNASRPVVVVIYGGAWRGGDASQCANISRALAARGFTVAAIDYRHAPEHRFPSQLDDVRRSLEVLRDSAATFGIDMHRLAVLGRSSGGHLAELAAFAPGGTVPIRAVVALYAPYDLIEGYRNLPSPDPIHVQSILRNFIGDTPEKMRDRYLAASPASFVREGLPPTLLIIAGKDHIVRPEFNARAAAELRAAHVPVIAVELPWAEHGFDMAPTGLGSQLELAVVASFLGRELKP